MDSFQSILEDNYKEFSNISRCISRFKSLNKVAKDGLLDDYDTIFRSLNTECEGLFEDMMSSFSENDKLTGTVRFFYNSFCNLMYINSFKSSIIGKMKLESDA